MIKKSNIIFSNLYGSQDPYISAAISRGDWLNTKKILRSSRQNIIETIKQSGLRGRGGAGFATGMKWDFMPKEIKNTTAPSNLSPEDSKKLKDLYGFDNWYDWCCENWGTKWEIELSPANVSTLFSV